jgi:hypothetical protein
MPSFNSARNLANLVGDAALHAHIRGDDVEALDRAMDVMALGRAVDAQPTLIAHLVGVGIDALAVHRIQVMAPALKVRAGDENDPVRQRVRQLIAQLLDDDAAAESLRRAFVAERVFQIETVREVDQKVWVIRPMYKLDLARMLAADATLMRAATQPTLGAARDVLGLAAPSGTPGVGTGVPATPAAPPPPSSRVLSATILQSLHRVIETDMRIRVDRHVAAISLAVRLYRVDHGGAWPATLDVLVPAYLPRVPNDPFPKDNRPLHYFLVKAGLPDGTDRPMLHSVGPDGVDAYDGTLTLIPLEPTYGWMRVAPRGPDDQFRDLARWIPPPSTRPAAQSAE